MTSTQPAMDRTPRHSSYLSEQQQEDYRKAYEFEYAINSFHFVASRYIFPDLNGQLLRKVHQNVVRLGITHDQVTTKTLGELSDLMEQIRNPSQTSVALPVKETYAYLMADLQVPLETIKQLTNIRKGLDPPRIAKQVAKAIDSAEQQAAAAGANRQVAAEVETQRHPAVTGRYMQALDYLTLEPLSEEEERMIDKRMKERQVSLDRIRDCCSASKCERLTHRFILEDRGRLSGDWMRLLYKYLFKFASKDENFLHKMDEHREEVEIDMKEEQWLLFYSPEPPKHMLNRLTKEQQRRGQRDRQARNSRSFRHSSSYSEDGSSSRQQAQLNPNMMDLMTMTGSVDLGSLQYATSMPNYLDPSSYGQTQYGSNPQKVSDFAALVSPRQRGLQAQQVESPDHRRRQPTSENQGFSSSSSLYRHYIQPNENVQPVQQNDPNDVQGFDDNQAYYASLGDFGRAPQGEDQESGLPFFPSTGSDRNQQSLYYWDPSFQEGSSGGGSGSDY